MTEEIPCTGWSTSVIRESMDVGIIVERRKIDNEWQPYRWQGVAVVAGTPDMAPGCEIESGDGWTRFYAGTLTIEIFGKETEAYKYNLANKPPKVFVVFREEEGSDAGFEPEKSQICNAEALGTNWRAVGMRAAFAALRRGQAKNLFVVVRKR